MGTDEDAAGRRGVNRIDGLRRAAVDQAVPAGDGAAVGEQDGGVVPDVAGLHQAFATQHLVHFVPAHGLPRLLVRRAFYRGALAQVAMRQAELASFEAALRDLMAWSRPEKGGEAAAEHGAAMAKRDKARGDHDRTGRLQRNTVVGATGVRGAEEALAVARAETKRHRSSTFWWNSRRASSGQIFR